MKCSMVVSKIYLFASILITHATIGLGPRINIHFNQAGGKVWFRMFDCGNK